MSFFSLIQMEPDTDTDFDDKDNDDYLPLTRQQVEGGKSEGGKGVLADFLKRNP
ncbi:MAG: hypothetical protein HGA97_07160 [Chlorobiaceae bacterium]|nr:hypothetical protein [Chlorobiaceae bacterium]